MFGSEVNLAESRGSTVGYYKAQLNFGVANSTRYPNGYILNYLFCLHPIPSTAYLDFDFLPEPQMFLMTTLIN